MDVRLDGLDWAREHMGTWYQHGRQRLRQGNEAILHWLYRNTFIPAGFPSALRRRRYGYVLALLAALGAALVMFLLMKLVPTFAFSSALSFLIIALVALSWGAGPSIVATIFSVILIEGILTLNHPQHHSGWNAIVEAAVFMAVGIVTSVIASQTERARRRAEFLWQSLERERERTPILAWRQSSRRMDDFMGIASHELRTPLAVIKGSIQVASRRLSGMAETAEDGPVTLGSDQIQPMVQLLDRADRQVRRINQLVSDLTDISRIEAGRLQLAHEACDLNILITDLADTQRQLYPTRTILIEGQEGLVGLVQADPQRIEQVIFNYLSNALKYSEDDRPVIIRLSRDGAYVRVAVSDQGVGLTPSEQEHIWDRYRQAEGLHVVSGTTYGLGLGLYISRTIIEKHGGQYGVISTKGIGSTFWFALPR